MEGSGSMIGELAVPPHLESAGRRDNMDFVMAGRDDEEEQYRGEQEGRYLRIDPKQDCNHSF
jgi:hypothetical protein